MGRATFKHPFLPHTDADRAHMLEQVGFQSIDDLFLATGIPPEFLTGERLNLPEALVEADLLKLEKVIAAKNTDVTQQLCFIGAGAYDHLIPLAVGEILKHPGFWTAYTPYQPAVAQGKLQLGWEMQTIMARLTGMEVSNASHYDGANAVAASALMAHAIHRNKRSEILVSEAVNPNYKAVIKTMVRGKEITVTEIKADNGLVDKDNLRAKLNENVIAFIAQNPNFYGLIEDTTNETADLVHESGAKYIVGVSEALSLALLKPPGEYGADIVAGEGQSFGNPLSFGGPYWGFMAAGEKDIRQLPGRIFGLTEDELGRAAYALILGPREQHIRREKATSNICSNQWLCLAVSAAYLLAQGEQGLRNTAEQNVLKAHHAFEQILDIPGCKAVFPGRHFFNEFAINSQDYSPESINLALASIGIRGGYDLGKSGKHHGSTLYCVTEARSAEDIGKLVGGLRNV